MERFKRFDGGGTGLALPPPLLCLVPTWWLQLSFTKGPMGYSSRQGFVGGYLWMQGIWWIHRPHHCCPLPWIPRHGDTSGPAFGLHRGRIFFYFEMWRGEARDFCDWEAHKKEWAQGLSLARGDLLDPTLGIQPKGSCGADGVEWSGLHRTQAQLASMVCFPVTCSFSSLFGQYSLAYLLAVYAAALAFESVFAWKREQKQPMWSCTIRHQPPDTQIYDSNEDVWSKKTEKGMHSGFYLPC